MSDYTFNSISVVKINPHRLRNILIGILTLLFVISFFSTSSAIKGLKAIHVSGSLEVYPFSKNSLPSFSSISFFSSDKKALLKGWFFNKEDSKKVIIFVHDFSKNRLVFGDETDLAINMCMEKGYSVLLFDQRASGNVASSVSTLGLNEAYDLKGAIEYAKNLDMRQIYLVGFGTGADSIMYSDISKEAEAWVLDSPYFELNKAIKFIYRDRNIKTVFYTKTFTKIFMRIFDRTLFQNLDSKHFVDSPSTMITRSGFSYMDTDEEKKLYDILSVSNENVLLAAISTETNTKAYMELILEFFDKYTVEQ